MGRYISAADEHAGASPRNETKTTEPDGDDSKSDTSSEAGDGDLTQVKPSLEEECKLVGVALSNPYILLVGGV